ncbi:capsule biosynthesis GfcC family protein [Shewanella sp. MF05960]|uniref:capsule biosynthesis GfcC family protein n=1 Tax=Shewanella sp. MF05960 TaxID=3434874 RepID=UPI003D78F678
MKPLIQLFLALMLLICNLPLSYAETEVTVTQSVYSNSTASLTYVSPPRLVQVIQDSLSNAQLSSAQSNPLPIYWLGAGLYDASSEAALLTQRQQILNALKTQYSDMGKPDHIQALKTLATWIANNQFLQREFIPLDYDVIRLKEELNPLLQGKYLLTLPGKPQYVMVLGAVTQNGSQPFVVRQNASQYIENAMPLNASQNSYAWLIQPDGQVEKYPIAYWNQQHIDIAPGAIIYLDFDGVRNNEPELNQQILELIRHWIR